MQIISTMLNWQKNIAQSESRGVKCNKSVDTESVLVLSSCWQAPALINIQKVTLV